MLHIKQCQQVSCHNLMYLVGLLVDDNIQWWPKKTPTLIGIFWDSKKIFFRKLHFQKVFNIHLKHYPFRIL